MSLSPHYLHLNYNETPRKYGFKALSCHWLCRPQYNPPPGATPKSAHAALLLSCPIFTCVVLYMTRVSARTHIHYRSLTRTRTHCTVKCLTCIRTPRRAARESQSAWLGQLSCEVSYADWTYADPFRFLFCADLLVGASSCHDFVLSFVGKGGAGVGATLCMECVRVWLRTMLASSGLVGFACACRKSERRERRDRNVGSEERARTRLLNIWIIHIWSPFSFLM